MRPRCLPAIDLATSRAQAMKGSTNGLNVRFLNVMWDLPTRKMLVAKAYRALPPGGALIVYDPLIDDDRSSDAHCLLSSLNMLIETAGVGVHRCGLRGMDARSGLR